MPNQDKDYQNLLPKSQLQLDDIIANENKGGMHIDEFKREEEPTSEILAIVKERKIDLIVILAYEEGRLEQFLFGCSNAEQIRKMQCSILLA